jgi:cupin fold WbuC family metalloprotein
MKMELKRINDEVLYATDPIVEASRADLDFLHQHVSTTPRKRIRLCAHTGTEDLLHEMLIVLEAGGYVQPHRHVGKSESYHVIEGSADLILFDDNGRITRVIEMGDSQSDKTFFLRFNCMLYHTVHVTGKRFTFHEITNGPLDREKTQYAQWAPAEGDAGVADYTAKLMKEISLLRQPVSK